MRVGSGAPAGSSAAGGASGDALGGVDVLVNRIPDSWRMKCVMLAIFGGALFTAACAQISIPIPPCRSNAAFTPKWWKHFATSPSPDVSRN